MNRFLLQLASMEEASETATGGSRQEAAQILVKEQTQSLVTAYLEMGEGSNGKKMGALDVKLFDRLTSLVKDMLAGYDKLPDNNLALMSWLNPVLSTCIHTDNESIRIAIQRLLQRLN